MMSKEWVPSISLEEIDKGDPVMWLVMSVNGKPFYKLPLAQVLRDYIDERHPEPIEPMSLEHGERAFTKLAIGKALDHELTRA